MRNNYCNFEVGMHINDVLAYLAQLKCEMKIPMISFGDKNCRHS